MTLHEIDAEMGQDERINQISWRYPQSPIVGAILKGRRKQQQRSGFYAFELVIDRTLEGVK
jgi:hypothetical protein